LSQYVINVWEKSVVNNTKLFRYSVRSFYRWCIFPYVTNNHVWLQKSANDEIDIVTVKKYLKFSILMTVEIPLLICQTMYLSQVIFSFFFLLWNGMIATVIVSVARTHTIAIRYQFHHHFTRSSYALRKQIPIVQKRQSSQQCQFSLLGTTM